MEKEFNLSEKRNHIKKSAIMAMTMSGVNLKFAEEVLNRIFNSIEDQDKEFIEKIRKEAKMLYGLNGFLIKINELVGEELR